MEIKISNTNGESYFFKESCIYGITGNGSDTLLEMINGKFEAVDWTAYIDSIVVNYTNYEKLKINIGMVNDINDFYTINVEREFNFIAKFVGYSNTDLPNRILSVLTMVGLNDNYLKRNTRTLSASEKFLVKFAIVLMYKPNIILLNTGFSSLDNNNKKRVITILRNLKEDNRIILIVNNDSDLLYILSDEIMILSDGKIIENGNTREIYTSDKVLSNSKYNLPNLPLITYKAKQLKNIKLSYHKDTRDIIKDIYKHV